ncbi:MAG: putative damage-inducible protein DinB [Saprospiraceae bacterium]|jgi:uncharacterized damage-inducible protein DinB
MNMTPWIERKFTPVTDNGRLATIIERLDGTEYRLIGKLADDEGPDSTTKIDGKWSIVEEIGHLYTLELLWIARVKEIVAGKETLQSADMSNKATTNGKFNTQDLEDLLDGFGERREELLSLLRKVKPEDLEKKSQHPRLERPMGIVDLAYFVAEHDDHHLAKISKMLDA